MDFLVSQLYYYQIADTWDAAFGPGHQWYNVGSHLRNCKCSTPRAREIVEEMHNGLLHGTHK